MKPLKRIGSHSAPPDENSNTARISAFFRKKPKKQHIYLMGILLAVIFLAAAAITIRTVSDRKQYKQYISMAKDNFAQQEYDSALSNLRKALSAEHTEECVILMAECYRAQGKYDKALETLRAANTRAKSISAKIKEIESERDSLRDAEKISVAGKMYPESTTDLVLDDLSLENGVLDDVVKLYSLTDLSLQNNRLTDISALSSLGGLSTLNLSGNKIRDISPLLNLTGKALHRKFCLPAHLFLIEGHILYLLRQRLQQIVTDLVLGILLRIVLKLGLQLGLQILQIGDAVELPGKRIVQFRYFLCLDGMDSTAKYRFLACQIRGMVLLREGYLHIHLVTHIGTHKLLLKTRDKGTAAQSQRLLLRRSAGELEVTHKSRVVNDYFIAHGRAAVCDGDGSGTLAADIL